MARDDYDVVVYKILVYLYACMKGKLVFDKEAYNKAIDRKAISEDYLFRIYKMMADEDLIGGVATEKAWGNILLLLSSERFLYHSFGDTLLAG